MTGKYIDGKRIASDLREKLRIEVANLKGNGVHPCLAVIIVGDDPASHIYVNSKVRTCGELGIISKRISFEPSVSEADLLNQIIQLNEDKTVHGILVQLPIPNHIDKYKVIETISPSKDVDGFHPINIGRMMTDQDTFISCTPYGIIKMLQSEKIDIAGKHAVVIGRSHIVGKPMGQLLLSENATVTYAHSYTTNLKELTKQADILIAAVGIAKMIKAEDVKPGAVVIDVGMNRIAEERLCGDVDFDAVKEVASHITPVPGGVGPMTITMLMFNTVKAAKRIHSL